MNPNHSYIKPLTASFALMVLLSIKILYAEDSPRIAPLIVTGSMQQGKIPGFLKVDGEKLSVNFRASAIGSILDLGDDMIIVRLSPGIGTADQTNLIIFKKSQPLDEIMNTIYVALAK